MMTGKYVYGIIDSDEGKALDIVGLGGAVYTTAYRGVGCVLSDYFGPALQRQPKEQIVQSLLVHQQVAEHVMTQHTVLPVKFGTILDTSDEVYRLLSQGHSQLRDALSRMMGRVEIEVAATWSLDRVLAEVGGEDEIVRAGEDMARDPERATFERRIMLGKLVKASLDRRRDSYRKRMTEFLEPEAIDSQPSPLVSDQMVLSVAFLLDKAYLEKFNSKVGQLNDLFYNQINFRIIGPLPPYSFATVEVIRSTREIEEARGLLGLGESISEKEVRKAYRRLAAEAHPDSRVASPTARAQFARLHQAAELLVDYCRGQPGATGNLSVSVKRRRPELEQSAAAHEAGHALGVARG